MKWLIWGILGFLVCAVIGMYVLTEQNTRVIKIMIQAPK